MGIVTRHGLEGTRGDAHEPSGAPEDRWDPFASDPYDPYAPDGGDGDGGGGDGEGGDKGGDKGGDSGDSDVPPRRHRRSRRRKVLLTLLGIFVAGVLAVAGGLWWAYEHYTGRVDRIPNAFPTNVPEKARPKPTKGGENYLLVGIDARSDMPLTGSEAGEHEWVPGAQRSDTMMLVHIPEDRSGGYVVSLPRDSWVSVPGHGRAKLNASFSWGGPPLLIDTVQRLTDVKVDHLAVIDWSGFKKLTDALGGVDIAGAGHMSGEEALAYVRERKNLPRGDLDRTHRQQSFLRAVISETMSSGNLTNPLKAKELLDAITSTVSVDDRFSDGAMRDLLWDMKGVRSDDLVFMNAPVSGTGMVGDQSVVHLDRKAGDRLWQAMRDDTMAEYVERNPIDELGSVTP